MNREPLGRVAVLFVTSLVALAATSSSWAAPPGATTGTTEEQAYASSDGTCFDVSTSLQQGFGDSAEMMHIQGYASQHACGSVHPIVAPAGNVAVRYTLWKWDGSQAVACHGLDWSYSGEGRWDTSISLPTSNAVSSWGCGDGFYNVGVEGAAWLDGAWRSRLVFSGWLDIDVNDDPPILL